ncbi:peptidoglycan-binding domain-containing protein [Streptomyces niveus]
MTVDGNFGSATRQSVVSFQSLHSLTADGAVGQNTWLTLTGTV